MRWLIVLLTLCCLTVACSNDAPNLSAKSVPSPTIGVDDRDDMVDDDMVDDGVAATGSSDAAPTTTVASNGRAVTPFETDPTLRWTVLAVAFDDVLNVRAQPDPASAKIGALEPWATDLTVSDQFADTSDGIWRRVALEDGRIGWVNARFLVAQPIEYRGEDGDTLFALTSEILTFLRSGDGAAPDTWLAPRALWVGGIGIYADASTPFTWIPRPQLLTAEQWTTDRTFDDPIGADSCGTDCSLPLTAFLKIDAFDAAAEMTLGGESAQRTLLADGVMATVPDSLQWVRVFEPGTDTAEDWARLAFVFDHSGGAPRLKAAHIWGWTP